jgi:hypothetical protein
MDAAGLTVPWTGARSPRNGPRVDQIGRTLGIVLTEPAGLTRARLALTAWRLLDT